MYLLLSLNLLGLNSYKRVSATLIKFSTSFNQILFVFDPNLKNYCHSAEHFLFNINNVL